MKRVWTEEELAANWLLLPGELEIIREKQGVSRLGFAVLLKFFHFEGRFPDGPHEIPVAVLHFVAQQVGVKPDLLKEYPWQGRTVERHRAIVRTRLGFREPTVKDAEKLEMWVLDEVLDREHRPDRLKDAVIGRCRKLCIKPPAAEQIRRLIGSAVQRHETRFCEAISQKFDSATMDQLDTLLESDPSRKDEEGWTLWQTLREEPGKAGLDSVKEAASRLRLLRKVGLPAELFQGVLPKLIEHYAKRAAQGDPHGGVSPSPDRRPYRPPGGPSGGNRPQDG